MKRSLIPGFIKRRSISHFGFRDEGESSSQKDTDIGTAENIESKRYFEEIKLLRAQYSSSFSASFDEDRTTPDYEFYHDFNSSGGREQYRKSITKDDILRENASYLLSSLNLLSTSATLDQALMVDQDDIIALTKHVRSFSDVLNKLRDTFNEPSLDAAECQEQAHERLSEVLSLLKFVLAKYPLLNSPDSDILNAATNIIKKIKSYDYGGNPDGPPDFYKAIDQLALSFSSSVSDFLLGDKEISQTSPGGVNDQYGESYPDDDFDAPYEDESEDMLDKFEDIQVEEDTVHTNNDHLTSIEIPASPTILIESDVVLRKKDASLERTDALDKALINIQNSVELALKRTKVFAKYSKDILLHIERRAHLELEFSKSCGKLASQTRSSIMEESYLPFQSIYVTALDNDIQFSNSYQKSCQSQLYQIIESLKEKQKDHEAKRAKIKIKWKNELKKVAESRENLKLAKTNYMRKQKDLEKYVKQQLDGKDEKFSIGKKKHQDDFKKSAEESEDQYKQCVEEANVRQHEMQRVKADVLFDLRELIYSCDKTMKSVTIAYFKMMDVLLSPLPVQFRTLTESSGLYEEGQQFSDFVRLQQSMCNQAMIPTYVFEKYKGDSAKNSLRLGTDTAISSDDFVPTLPVTTMRGGQRRHSVNSAESDRPGSPNAASKKKNNKNKGSATDDTDSISSRSLPGTPHDSPSIARKQPAFNKNAAVVEKLSDDEADVGGQRKTDIKDEIFKSKSMPGPFRNQKLSSAAKMHKFRKLRASSKCKECESYVYFNGAECEKCGLVCHKKCLEKLAIKCGNKRLPRKMTTFGVDFHQHLAATKRRDIPYIIEKCIDEIDDNGLSIKGIYRVSGVKSKVEKLCQQFEVGGGLVDLSTTPPHFVASVLKLYLRQLPEPLLTFKMYPSFIKIAKDSMNLKLDAIGSMTDDECTQYEDVIRQLHDIVKQLPDANYYTAAKLIRHLKRVSENHEETQMNAQNLAIVFGPTLLRPEGDPTSLACVMDMVHQTKSVELLILNTGIFQAVDSNSIEEADNAEITKSPKKAHTMEVLPESPSYENNHQRQESNLSVCSEFTQEVMSLMDVETQNASKNEVRQMKSTDSDVLPDPDRESDLLGDLPPGSHKPAEQLDSLTSTTSVTSTTTDYESAHEQLSSMESLLTADSSGVHSSPGSVSKEPDDVWMSQYTPAASRDSAGSTEESAAGNLDGTETVDDRLKSFARLETTTYSFSLGGGTTHDFDDETLDEDSSAVWVKRDSKERVPFRKLKPVPIKSTVTQSNPSPEGSPMLKSTPFTLNERKRGDSTTDTDDTKPVVENEIVPSESKQPLPVKLSLTKLQNLPAAEQSLTKPKQPPPMVLPRPKKTLEKKSWTADLIKSKQPPLSTNETNTLVENRKAGTLSRKQSNSQLSTDEPSELMQKLNEQKSKADSREVVSNHDLNKENNDADSNNSEQYV